MKRQTNVIHSDEAKREFGMYSNQPNASMMDKNMQSKTQSRRTASNKDGAQSDQAVKAAKRLARGCLDWL